MTELLKAGDKVQVDLDTPTSSWHKAEGVVVADQITKNGTTLVRLTKNGPDTSYPRTIGKEYRLVRLTKIADFKEGDRVTVKGYGDPGSAFEGRTGIVDGNDTDVYVTVNFEEDGKLYKSGTFQKKYIVAAEPFGFDDIQKGDTVRRTTTYKTGATQIAEGVAHTKGSYYWDTEDGMTVAFSADKDDKTVKIELVNRPEPVEKTTDNRKTGDTIILFKEDKYSKIERVFIKQKNGNWTTVNVQEDAKGGRGFVRTDAQVEEFLTEKNHELVLVK